MQLIKQKNYQVSYLEKNKTIAVVLPVYNPPSDWWHHAYLHCKLLAEIEPLFHWQFHFVDDGSLCSQVFPLPKGRYTEGDNLHIFFHNYAKNQGKGHAIRYGLRQIDDEAEIFMHCDWDFPFGAELIQAALYELKKADVVVADRGNEYLTHLPSFRRKLTQSQRLFNRHILRLKTTDTQAGFKAFNEKGKDIFLKTKVNGFLFDTEFVRLSERNYLSINTLNARCRHNLQFKNFRFKVILKEVINLFRLIIQ